MKNRPKYGLFDNLQFLLRRLWALSRKLTIYVFLYAPVTVGTAYAGVMLSREVVTLAERGSTPVRVVLTVGALTGVLIIARAAEKCLDAAIPKLMMMADLSLQIELLDVLIRGDYEKNETTSGLTRLSKAMENVGSDSSGVRRIRAAFVIAARRRFRRFGVCVNPVAVRRAYPGGGSGDNDRVIPSSAQMRRLGVQE